MPEEMLPSDPGDVAAAVKDKPTSNGPTALPLLKTNENLLLRGSDVKTEVAAGVAAAAASSCPAAGVKTAIAEAPSQSTTDTSQQADASAAQEDETIPEEDLRPSADYSLVANGLVDMAYVALEAARPVEELPPPAVGEWVESKAAHQDAQIFRAKVVERYRHPEHRWVFRLRSPDMASCYVEPLKHVRKGSVWSLARELDLAGGRKARRQSQNRRSTDRSPGVQHQQCGVAVGLQRPTSSETSRRKSAPSHAPAGGPGQVSSPPLLGPPPAPDECPPSVPSTMKHGELPSGCPSTSRSGEPQITAVDARQLELQHLQQESPTGLPYSAVCTPEALQTGGRKRRSLPAYNHFSKLLARCKLPPPGTAGSAVAGEAVRVAESSAINVPEAQKTNGSREAKAVPGVASDVKRPVVAAQATAERVVSAATEPSAEVRDPSMHKRLKAKEPLKLETNETALLTNAPDGGTDTSVVAIEDRGEIYTILTSDGTGASLVNLPEAPVPAGAPDGTEAPVVAAPN